MQIEENKPLQNLNTFGLTAKAKYFATITSQENLIELLQQKIAQTENLFPIGGGSNILLTQDVNALVIHNQIKGIELTKEDDNFYYVEAGSGENWHEFVLFCLHHNWFGAENLSLIPGSVGAAPMQNIGAYGIELKEVFDYLETVDIKTGKVLKFNKNECEFGYRSSIFKTRLKGQTIITKVGFKFPKNYQLNTSYGAINQELENLNITSPTPLDVSQAVINIRSSKLPDPKKIGNSGSFFKNPVVSNEVYENILKKYPTAPNYKVSETEVKVPAGWLIETAGWKGKTFDNRFGVHKNQALVLVNYGGAIGHEIYNLSEQIMQDIKAKFGIELEREVNII